MKRVVLVHGVMKQYRVPLFIHLNELLKRDGIQFTAYYSEPNPRESLRGGNAELPEPVGRKVKAFWFRDHSLVFQPAVVTARADLVIVEQGNRYLQNPLVFLQSKMGIKKVAFLGHGWDRSGRSSSFSDRLKKIMLNRADWWFAYTPSTVAYLTSQGVSSEKITNIQNAMDTTELRKDIENLDDAKASVARQRFGLPANSPTGIYCGSLYPQKLRILLEALPLIKKRVPDFQLLIVGSGEKAELIEHLAGREPWIHYLGARFAAEKAALLRISDVFLMPESAGLSVLDAFTAGLPFLTTKDSFHGPEIDYVFDGVNGIVANHDAPSFAEAVANVLSDVSLKNRLSAGARDSGRQYTLDETAERFREGIRNCLKMSMSPLPSLRAQIHRLN